MIAQAVGVIDERFETGAGDDVDVRRSCHVATPERIQAVTPALHALWIVRQPWWQVPRGGEIGLVAPFAQEPDPTRAQPEKVGHLLERRLHGVMHVNGTAERFRNA